MCPRLSVKPENCIELEADFWQANDTEEGTVCPVLLVPEFDYEFKAYNMFSKNQTPNAVGWENETYVWNQAMETISMVMAQVQSERMEAMKQNNSNQ